MKTRHLSVSLIAAALLAAFVPPSPAQTPGDEPASEGRQLYELGLKHQKGEGMPRDLEKANELYLRAGELGYGRGFSKLGDNYRVGIGVKVDVPKAIELYNRACELGEGWGFFGLGILHDQGIGFPADPREANRLYRKAGELGFHFGWYNLGMNYLKGDGVPEDPRLANDCFAKAGELGSAAGWNALARSYETGRGVNVDLYRAVELYERALEMDDGFAGANLGTIYLDGKGVGVDRDRGLAYLRKGADLWNSTAALRLVKEGIRFAPTGDARSRGSIPQAISAVFDEAEIHLDLERFDEAIRLSEGIIADLDPADAGNSAAWMRAHTILCIAYRGKAMDPRLANLKETDRLIELSLQAGSKGMEARIGTLEELRNAVPDEYAQLMSARGYADTAWCSAHEDYTSAEGARRWTQGTDRLTYATYLSQNPVTFVKLKLAYARAAMRAGSILREQNLYEEGLEAAEQALRDAKDLDGNVLLKAQVKMNLGTGILLHHHLLGDLNSFHPDFIRAEKLVAEGVRTYEQIAPGTQLVVMGAGVLADFKNVRVHEMLRALDSIGGGSTGGGDDDAERQRILRGMDAANRRAAQQGLQQPYPGVQ